MNVKAIIVIAVAAVVVVAGAAVAAMFLLKDDTPSSDYTLFDTIKTEGVKGGLHYIVESKEPGASYKTTWQSAEKDPGEAYYFFAIESEYDYSDYKCEFDPDVFYLFFFDYVDSQKVPSGVSVTYQDVESNREYTITGEGTIADEYGSSRTVKFNDLKLLVNPLGSVISAKGDCSVKGKLKTYYSEYDLDIKDSYSSSNDRSGVRNGDYSLKTSRHFDTVDDVLSAFSKFDEASQAGIIKEAKDVSYKGVDAREVTLDGTLGAKHIEGTVHHYKGYLIDSDAKIDGEESSYKVQIYYI